MPFNQAKFDLLREESANSNAALVKLGDQRRDAKARLNRLEIEAGNARGKLSRELESDLRHASAEHERLLAAEERAAQEWHELGAIVRKCEEFLTGKGICI